MALSLLTRAIRSSSTCVAQGSLRSLNKRSLFVSSSSTAASGSSSTSWRWKAIALGGSIVVGVVAFTRSASSASSASTTDAAPLSPSEFRSFVLREVHPINYNTKLFRFGLSSPEQKINLPVASCLVTRAVIGGEEVIRPYTPVEEVGTTGHFDLIVKDYAAGKMSRHITSLNVGDSLEMKGPFPKLKYKPNMHKHIAMVCGGTGITPMLQVLRAILHNKEDQTKVSLIFANVSEEDILLREELETIARSSPSQVQLLFALERPPSGWTQGVGRVDAKMLSKIPPPSEDVLVLVCGPDPMLAAIAGPKGPNYTQGEVGGLLAQLGYSSSQVYKF